MPDSVTSGSRGSGHLICKNIDIAHAKIFLEP